MEKFPSLADFLGVQDPVRPDLPAAAPPSRRLSAKDFALGILNSDEYRASIMRRVLLDELPPQIESLLYHYAHGKPVERVEVKDTTDPLEELSVEQLEERARRLLDVARSLRVDEDEQAQQREEPSVH